MAQRDRLSLYAYARTIPSEPGIHLSLLPFCFGSEEVQQKTSDDSIYTIDYMRENGAAGED